MKTTLRPTKEAWREYGRPRVENFPHYQPRLPEIAQLCGIYSIRFGLPNWWPDLVTELQRRGFESPIIELFRGATPEEFRQGRFETSRHKEHRAELSQKAKKLISSPKIGKFLLEQFGVTHPFTVFLNNRGDKLREKEIVISGDPWDIITMASRGKSWRSCLHFANGSNREQVWANLCDSGIVLVFVRTKGDLSERDMDTRVILRYVWTYRQTPKEASKGGVVLDRFYGDASYVQAIQDLVSKVAWDHGLALFEYERYNSHQEGKEVHRMAQTNSEILTVRGPSVDFRGVPPSWQDNAEWKEEKKHRGFHRLEAKVQLVNPSLAENSSGEPPGI